MLELDAVGDDDICTQVLKLSDDNWYVPEHDVLDVLVVTTEELISSENVTEVAVSVETEETPLLGEVEVTTGENFPSILSSSLE